MPKNKKKFIPKKNALVFHLVHRSQQDPLTVDENAPQHVLKEYLKKKSKEEEQKYGIFFDDDYDYLKHLKTTTGPLTEWEQVNYKQNEKRKDRKSSEAKILLPSSVFQSDFEESVGLLNKAAPVYGPRLELDPDLVAAMDDDFDYDNPDNILEENFVELANQPDSEVSDEYDSEVDDVVKDLGSEISFGEAKSRFTDYSMTSSVIRRNEQLTLLDNHFEKVFEKYDDSELGCLQDEDIEGSISFKTDFDSNRLLELIEKPDACDESNDPILKSKTILAAAKQESNEEETDVLVVDDNQEKWDCESILSTYSNLYNHPAKISEPKGPGRIRVDPKTGIPLNVLDGSRLTAQKLSRLEDECEGRQSGPKSIVSYISELSIRPKDETSEEKKIRKQNLREFRRDRRQEKKANKMAFKTEKSLQEKILLNLKNNQRRIKMF